MDKKAQLQELLEENVVRLATRQHDFDVFNFQAEVDPSYRRAQVRYIGGGGTGMHHDKNVKKAEHFTLTMLHLPPGQAGPVHVHHDVEEVFFVIEGQLTCIWEQDGEIIEAVLGPKDMVWNPVGINHGFRNDTDQDCNFLIMLGAARPELPSYPLDPALEERNLIRKAKQTS